MSDYVSWPEIIPESFVNVTKKDGAQFWENTHMQLTPKKELHYFQKDVPIMMDSSQDYIIDLSNCHSSPLSNDVLRRLFAYQPFRLPDGTVTGSGYGQVRQSKIRYLHPSDTSPDIFNDFLQCNQDFAKMHMDIILSMKKELGGFNGLSFLDIACNAGFFCYNYAMHGAQSVFGVDGYNFSNAFSLMNEYFQLKLNFIQGQYDMILHKIPLLNGTFDVVSNIAFMCHIPDPTYFLEYIATLTNRCLVIMSRIPDEGADLTIRYAREEAMYYGRTFPICFDAATAISERLLRVGLKACGFQQVKEIPRQEYWIPRGDAWRCFIAIR